MYLLSKLFSIWFQLVFRVFPPLFYFLIVNLFKPWGKMRLQPPSSQLRLILSQRQNGSALSLLLLLLLLLVLSSTPPPSISQHFLFGHHLRYIFKYHCVCEGKQIPNPSILRVIVLNTYVSRGLSLAGLLHSNIVKNIFHTTKFQGFKRSGEVQIF